MPSRLLAEIGRTPRIALLEHLKIRGPQSVGELTRLMGMSYMGVKKHCVDLQEKGYVEAQRRPSSKGRPELEYCLAGKTRTLFAAPDCPLSVGLLQAAGRLFGPGAPEKLLFAYFQAKGEEYAEKIRGDGLAARMRSLASLREGEGYYSTCQLEPQMALIDNHHPLRPLFDEYPSVRTLECRMLEQVLETRLKREEVAEGEFYRCSYIISEHVSI